MARFDILTFEQMSDEQRALTEANQAAGGRLRGGPYWAYLYDPELMRKQMALNDHVRDSSLDKRVRQIAIMTTVRFWNSEYPWAVQARLSHELGVDAAIIDAINNGERPRLDDSRFPMYLIQFVLPRYSTGRTRKEAGTDLDALPSAEYQRDRLRCRRCVRMRRRARLIPAPRPLPPLGRARSYVSNLAACRR